MQYKSSNESMTDTLQLRGFEQPFVQEQSKTDTNSGKRNSITVTKLSLKDKAGLVFVVAVLLLLQLMEKVKLLK